MNFRNLRNRFDVCESCNKVNVRTDYNVDNSNLSFYQLKNCFVILIRFLLNFDMDDIHSNNITVL